MNIDKPIAILLQGPSVSELEDKIHLFKDRDWLWTSLNRFQMMEDTILSKIGKELDIVYCSSRQRLSEEYENVKRFLAREGTMFVTTTATVVDNPDLLDNTVGLVKSFDWGYGFNSLAAFLFILGKLGAKKVYLFGCDGHHSENQTYYQEETYLEDIANGRLPKDRSVSFPYSAQARCIKSDSEYMNSIFWKYWEMIALRKEATTIVNVNPESSITCFSKCSYEEVANGV